MTRSIKALSGAAMLAALALPAVASAQDTTMTRTTRDSAGGHNMRGMQSVRFDTTQAVTLTGVTIVRLDSIGGGTGAWNAGGSGGMGTAASGAMGTARGAMTPSAGESSGQTLSAIVRSGSDSMQVVLGPSEYLTSQQLTLATGDVISIKGVRIQMGAGGMGTGASGAMSGSSSTGSTTGSGSTGSMATSSAGGAPAMTAVLATEITKNGKTVALRDKSTGSPNWGGMGTEAGRNRGRMTPPSTTRDTSMIKRDTSSTKRDTSITSPVRKP